MAYREPAAKPAPRVYVLVLRVVHDAWRWSLAALVVVGLVVGYGIERSSTTIACTRPRAGAPATCEATDTMLFATTRIRFDATRDAVRWSRVEDGEQGTATLVFVRGEQMQGAWTLDTGARRELVEAYVRFVDDATQLRFERSIGPSAPLAWSVILLIAMLFVGLYGVADELTRIELDLDGSRLRVQTRNWWKRRPSIELDWTEAEDFRAAAPDPEQGTLVDLVAVVDGRESALCRMRRPRAERAARQLRDAVAAERARREKLREVGAA